MAYLVGPTGALIDDSTAGVLPDGGILLVGSGNAAPTFPGPNIGAQSGTVGLSVSNSVASKFSDSDALTFSAIGSWPPGLSVSSAGVITGTPTTAGTYASLSVRATDTIAQTVDSDTFTYTISAAAAGATISATTAAATFSGSAQPASGLGTFTSEVLKDNTGAVVASKALTFVALYHDTTNALVVKKTGLSTNGSGIFSFSDAAVTTGQTYRVDWEDADGRRRMPRKAAT